MLLLPKKVGSYTLQRKLGTGGVAESYVGTHDTAGGRPVVVRRVLPYVLRDASRLASVEGRVKDLLGVRHPFLVHVLESFADGEERYLVEEHIDGVNLDKVLTWCRQNHVQVPHNVFLNIATQVCNGLEALHGRTGKGTSAEHVLHLGLKPASVFVTRDGKVMVGGYGLTRSPTALPHGGVAGPVPTRMEYLSPEQTHPDQKLTPSSDIFSLGAVLYELLTLDSLFRADSNLQTIHRVRRAEVTTQLLRVKELMPGLDKVLYRALSLNPRHRYQRAFVLREDLRGLMAGYSFATIAEDTRAFLAPLLDTLAPALSVVDAAPDAPAGADSFSETPITHVDIDPMASAEAAMARRSPTPTLEPVAYDAGEHTENTSPGGAEDPPTEVRREAAPMGEELDRPTLPGQHAEPEGTLPAELRRAPPDPTVSSPDLHRIPPPAPVQLAPLASATPLPAPNVGAPLAEEPENTAAYIAQERGDILPAGVSPSDTAAFLAQPQPPGPPPTLPPPPKLPPPPTLSPPTLAPTSAPELPAPPSPAPAPASEPGFSRPMPGPSLSRPMPPPTLPPKPVAPPPAPAAPAPVAAAPAAPAPVAPAPVAPVAPAPPPPAPMDVDAFAEPEPSGSGRSLFLVGGAAAALVAVLTCGGGAYALWANFGGGSTETVAATEPAAPAAAPGTGSDAAAVMADDAPPRVEPVTDEGTDDAVLAAATAPPAPEEPAEPAPVAPKAEPAKPAAAEPVATTAARPAATPTPKADPVVATPSTRATSTASAPAAATPTTSRSTSVASAPATTSTKSSTSTASTSTSTTKASTTSPASTSRTSAPAVATTSSAPTSTSTRAAASIAPSASTSRAPATTAFETPPDVSVEETPVSDLDQYVDAAKKGKLQSTDVAVLEMIDTNAPDYTRSRALLLMNAQRKGDDKATRRYLDQLMVLPENQYNPVYLVDFARWHVNHGEYDKALDKASLADRHWARIPPELVFSKRAEIYEIQAAAYQGKFYKSDEDKDLLANAIKGWERYRQHVATKSRTDLQKRADAELARLQDIKERLQ